MNSRNAAAWTLTTLHECVKKNYECSSWCRSYITFQYFCHGYVKKYDGKQILSTLYLYITNSWFIFFVYYLFQILFLVHCLESWFVAYLLSLQILFLVDCLKSWLWPPANICAILNFIFGTLLKSWLWSTYYSYYLCYFEFHFWYIVCRVDCGLLTLRWWLRAQSSLSIFVTKLPLYIRRCSFCKIK